MKTILSLLLFAQVAVSCAQSKKENPITHADKTANTFPLQTGPLNDFEGVFTDAQKKDLSERLDNFKETTDKEIFVVSVETYFPKDDFQEFTVNLANDWKKNGANNTVFIVFSKENRKIALSIYPGTTNLKDKDAQDVISEIVIPEFKKGNYYEAIKQGITALISKWK
ncbi:hypothetical protein HYN59_12010 [Flavobacterium album]|uniref:TPM domain-containing protein n=1 Tax=Flavobacterium album TaxID=2175091 RepID=A0A2S1QZF0_9FLAO|nr:TPM domain-containing protein [Flavobacterium album]AWH85790.1 hypothetical protein HYN59_12010 [Flavobacterium album]